MILLILAAVWIVVLAPSAIRRLTGRRGSTSIDTFHHELRLLKRSGPKLIAPAFRLETAFAGGTMARSSSGLPAVSSMPGRPSLVIIEPNSQMHSPAERTSEWPAARTDGGASDRRTWGSRGGRTRNDSRARSRGRRDGSGWSGNGARYDGERYDEYGQDTYDQAGYDQYGYDQAGESGAYVQYGAEDQYGSADRYSAEDQYGYADQDGYADQYGTDAYGTAQYDVGAYDDRYDQYGRQVSSGRLDRYGRQGRSPGRLRPGRRGSGPDRGNRRDRARRRRTRVMVVLVVIVGASAVAGLSRSRHMVWAITGVFGLVLVAFVGLAAYARFLRRPARRRPRRSEGRSARARAGYGAADRYGDQPSWYADEIEVDQYADEADPYGQADVAGESADVAEWYQDDQPAALWDDQDREVGDGSTDAGAAFWVEEGGIWDEEARTEQILYHFDDVRGRDDDTDGWEPIAVAR